MAIVGGGLAGIALLEQLRNFNVDCLLLESKTLGAGASGLNGGFCTPGWSLELGEIEKCVGYEQTKLLNKISFEGLNWLKEKCQEEEFKSASFVDGALSTSLSHSKQNVEKLVLTTNDRYGLENKYLSAKNLKEFVVSDRYTHGIQLNDGFHFHPLNFMRQMGASLVKSGCKIFENSGLKSFRKVGSDFIIKLSTGGTVKAKRLVLCTGGYASSEIGVLRNYWLPIDTYIAVTEPIKDLFFDLIRKPIAISDNRRAGNYYRFLSDGRLLWGRGVSALGVCTKEKLTSEVVKDLIYFFPQLEREIRKIKIDYVWSGKMAYSRHMMPYIGQLQPNLYALTAFGGHGMNAAPAGAILLAEQIANQGDRLESLRKFSFSWNGGMFGPLTAELYIKWLKLIDYFETLSFRRGLQKD